MTSTRTHIIGDLIDGGVRMEATDPTDAADLWSALTDPARLARWIATVDGDLRIGGDVSASFTSEWSGSVSIDVCEPPARLKVTLGPGLDDETTIEAVLTPEGEGCRLVITEVGLPTPDRPYHAAGWAIHLEDLASELRGETAEPWKARWQALVPSWLEQ